VLIGVFTNHVNANATSNATAPARNPPLQTANATSRWRRACPGTTARKLDWLASLHIRDEAYTKAQAELVNCHHRHPFSEHWGEATTSSYE
jgi:hypothetical protein